MDWTKSKSILIIALLITNLVIGMAYYTGIRKENKEQIVVAESTQAYLLEKGITLAVEIPNQILKKPVLFVRFETAATDGQSEPVYYDGMLVEASEDKGKSIVPLSYGETKRDVVSASYALLKFLSYVEGEEQEQLQITKIELIYLVDTSNVEQDISEDTAVPAWKITTSDSRSFYVNAYGE